MDVCTEMGKQISQLTEDLQAASRELFDAKKGNADLLKAAQFAAGIVEGELRKLRRERDTAIGQREAHRHALEAIRKDAGITDEQYRMNHDMTTEDQVAAVFRVMRAENEKASALADTLGHDMSTARDALKHIAAIPGTFTPESLKEVNGINDGRDRGIRLCGAVQVAREALGKIENAG